MVCIYCSGPTSVTNSRLQKRANQVWRRRKCLQCGAVFSTHEEADLEGALAVKDAASGSLQPFQRDKLLLSVYQSCAHRKTAVADARALTKTIISRLGDSTASGSISARDIAEAALKVLKNFDQAAAVHYQAFHPLAAS